MILRETRRAPTPRGASKAAIVETVRLIAFRVDGVESTLLQARRRKRDARLIWL
jgi:hypothetical protein